MNDFCKALTDFLRLEFEIEVEVFLSEKKKIVHMSLMKPLVSYSFFKDIIRFVRRFWGRRLQLYPGYFFVQPILNQSIKWRFDYITVTSDKSKQVKKK